MRHIAICIGEKMATERLINRKEAPQTTAKMNRKNQSRAEGGREGMGQRTGGNVEYRSPFLGALTGCGLSGFEIVQLPAAQICIQTLSFVRQ